MQVGRAQTYARRRASLPGMASLGASGQAGSLHHRHHRGVRGRPRPGWLGRKRERPDLVLFAALMLCVATTVELTKRAGENAGVTKDVYAVWELPIAILLPPVFALLAPLIRILLTQFRIRRVPVHRRVFTAGAVGLSLRAGLAGFPCNRPSQCRPEC